MTQSTKAETYKIVSMGKKGKLYITAEVMSQIRYLCQKMPNVEWSGVLFHTVKGDHTAPESFECTADFIYPMDMGSSAYTEYSFDGKFLDIYEKKPELLERRMSHIHSHNNMGVFFSGTDNEELAENAPNYDYYLSLIVNNKGDMTAKVAFMGEQEVNTPSFTFRGLKGKKHTIKGEKKVEPTVFTIDMDIYYLLDGVFLEQTEEIMKKPAPTYTQTYTAPHTNQTNHHHNTSNSSGKVFDVDAKKFLAKWIPQDMTKSAAYNASLWYDLSAAGRKYSLPAEEEAYREALVNTYDDFAERTFAVDKGVIAAGKVELLERCINIIQREGGSLAITKTVIQALKDCIGIEKITNEYNIDLITPKQQSDEKGQLKITGPGGQSI